MKNNIKKNIPGLYWKEILAILILLFAIVFFRNERREMYALIPQIRQTNAWWMFSGISLTFVYFFVQAGIYKKCFEATGLSLGWGKLTILYLKRNFIGVFLPAGGVSSLAYSPSDIREAGYNPIKVHQASALFGFTGFFTVVIAGIPILLFNIIHSNQYQTAWIGIVLLAMLLLAGIIAAGSIKNKGRLHKWLDKKFPSFTPIINELFAADINKKKITGAVFYSLAVELCGILHIYIAMLALGLSPSFGAAASAYIIAVLMMIVSPFLRGLGAVELSMVYVLKVFGYNSIQALSITILYRIFEFWLPLIAGLFAFAWKRRKLFLRLAPMLLTFMLGIVNIISVITPPIRQRLYLIREYLPLDAIHASNLLVLFLGIALLITTAYLFRGLRSAWLIALTISLFSLIGHLAKALDYEEAMLAGVTTIVLLITASHYRVRSSYKWMRVGFRMAFLSFTAVLIFGFISFYFFQKKHFGIDLGWKESFEHTLKTVLLIEDSSLHPLTRFGHEFIWLLRSLGFATWAFFLFSLLRPHFNIGHANESYKEKAMFLLDQYGRSSSDYFKTYKDKLYFFSDNHDAFIAYRIASNFAIVLEEPVCAEENKIEVLKEFDQHCRKMGLKTAFYRVDESSIPFFDRLNKSKMMIGQEAILEIENFSLEGKERKSLRNAMNSLSRKGYTTQVNLAPHTSEFIRRLREISFEWLEAFQKEEQVFSQGMFDEKELQKQDIITVSDSEGNIKAFLNIIPDYAEDECTYDLIRKTDDAPGGTMDALILKLIGYARERKKLYLNLGMAPLTGINQAANGAEQIIQMAANRVKRFRHYKGLREFKEKYATYWQNKYLIYENDFDLLQLPKALKNVMKYPVSDPESAWENKYSFGKN